MSRIEWTDETWNPTRGCSRVSPGCEHCYAERQAIRHAGAGGAYEGLVRMGRSGPRWMGTVILAGPRGGGPDPLSRPLFWRKPRRVFVNSMSDLFHEDLPPEDIAAVLGIMVAAPQHTYQVLTKRAARMRDWMRATCGLPDVIENLLLCASSRLRAGRASEKVNDALDKLREDMGRRTLWARWLRHIWLGVSVEDQQHADRRIPALLATPAAVRFVSYEPALGPVNFSPYLCGGGGGLDWVIIGGESGPGARPFQLSWGLDVVSACQAAGVPVFWKQMGAAAVEPLITNAGERLVYSEGCRPLRQPSRSKGGDPTLWPELFQRMGDLRQYPAPRTA